MAKVPRCSVCGTTRNKQMDRVPRWVEDAGFGSCKYCCLICCLPCGLKHAEQCHPGQFQRELANATIDQLFKRVYGRT
jgi:hypothetical protein